MGFVALPVDSIGSVSMSNNDLSFLAFFSATGESSSPNSTCCVSSENIEPPAAATFDFSPDDGGSTACVDIS